MKTIVINIKIGDCKESKHKKFGTGVAMFFMSMDEKMTDGKYYYGMRCIYKDDRKWKYRLGEHRVGLIPYFKK